VTPPLDQPSTSSALCEEQDFPASAQEEITPLQEESECVVHENKRSRLDDENEESSATTTINAEPEITVESPTAPGSTNNKRSRICDNTEESSAGVRTDHEPITIESPGPTPTRSPEDVMIVGDVQVASPEVIDLERLPTIRQGGSVVVDLTNDASFHDNNVVDLTRESSGDAVDSSPVIVCVNRIYRGDPIMQLPSCRFASFPSMLDRTFGITSTDDEIQEVANSNASGQNTSLETSTSSTDDPDTEPTQKNKITCPICMDDENTIKRRKRQLTSTTCGHVFCDKCIRSAVQMQNKCPTCRKKLSLRQLHPIFL